MKILLITGHFPPEKSGGVGRPYSLYKYLPENGVDVCVITKNIYSTLPGEKEVLRYGTFWTWRKSPLFSRKLFLKALSLITTKIYAVNYDSWWVTQVKKDVATIKAKNADLIYATFPGPEVLEAALILKNELNLPLIVEFRDGLAFESLLGNTNFLKKKTIIKLEKLSVKNSEVIITIGQTLSHYYRERYHKKVYTVFNGFDESDFEASDTNVEFKNKTKKHLIHFGALNNSKKSKRAGLFKALHLLKDKKIIDENNFCLLFIGNISNQEKKEIAAYRLSDIINFCPYMEKKKGFAFIKDHASALLFYGVSNETSVISSKLPEYINLHKPIIGICKGNEAELIIKKTGTGEVCDFDERSIEILLRKMMNDEMFYQPDHAAIEKFNRKLQTKEIAEIIKSSIVKKPATQ